MSAPAVSATSAFASFFSLFFDSGDLVSDIPAHFLALTLPQLASISNDLGAFTLTPCDGIQTGATHANRRKSAESGASLCSDHLIIFCSRNGSDRCEQFKI
jgi:hypothetical protein